MTRFAAHFPTKGTARQGKKMVYSIENLRYMHRNPVKRGLVEQPDQWKWSSFRAYFMARRVLCASIIRSGRSKSNLVPCRNLLTTAARSGFCHNRNVSRSQSYSNLAGILTNYLRGIVLITNHCAVGT